MAIKERFGGKTDEIRDKLSTELNLMPELNS